MENNFDFIIIGGGSAGCVLAARLSENTTFNVLLIEAGKKDTNWKIHVPAAFYKTFKTPLDWNYETLPQKHLNNRKLFVPRGKVMGGSGSINAMIYIRGHKEDFNEWERAGNPGWGYQDVLPFFVKSEHNENFSGVGKGKDGPLNVMHQINPNPLTYKYLEAAKQAGLETVDDFNDNVTDCAGIFQCTQKNGRRCSTAKAFLETAKHRKNLTILTQTFVRKICVEDGKATEVEVISKGIPLTFQAKKEIILSAGAINSPQLLMLSGIGESEQLKSKGINPVHHLPAVGKNLQDHPVVPLIYRCLQNITLDKAETLGNILKYLFFRKGPFTSILAEGGGYWRSDNSLTAPDIQLHFGPVFFVDHGFTRPEGNGISLGAILAKPKSRGEITLQSADPLVAPQINLNLLEHSEDMEAIWKGFKLCDKIFQAKAFAPYKGEIFSPEKVLQTKAEEIEYIRNTTEALYHPVSSCKMGKDAENSVVNHRLKVHGIERLRIADASIMPSITRGNTNAPSIMIGEKAAHIILEDWK